MGRRKKISVFVSYARKNKRVVDNFLEKFREQVSPSRRYEYSFWRDTDIEVGENWDEMIQEALNKCDIGLLLISPAFLGSKYIKNKELKKFCGKYAKPVIPVLLYPVDYVHHDLKGLREKQIFKLERSTFKKSKSYAECTGPNQRDLFAYELFKKVETKLDKLYQAKRGPFKPKRRAARKDSLKITSPRKTSVSEKRVKISGTGAKPGNTIILISLLNNKFFNPYKTFATSDKDGKWVHENCLLQNVRSERLIYALSINPNDLRKVQKIFQIGGKNLTIHDLKSNLEENKIYYQLSIGKRLIRVEK